MRSWWLAISVCCALTMLGVPGGALAQGAPSPVRLVVVLLQGWGTTNGDESFAAITPVLERVGTFPDVNLAVSVEPFSYRYPDLAYDACDTNRPVAASAERLNRQLQDLTERHPNARFVIVGHSLGGVVATRWAAVEAGQSLLDRTAAVVTLDSPLQGITDVPPTIKDLVDNWIHPQFCADRSVLDDLGSARAGSTLESLRGAADRLAVRGGRLYTAAGRGDLPIAARTAVLPGAEQRLFDTDVCADWAGLTGAVPGLTADVRTSDWTRIRTQLATMPPATQRAVLDRFTACMRASHGNVLQAADVLSWLAEIVQGALPMPLQAGGRERASPAP